MSSFIRIAGAAAVALSLGLMISALPLTYVSVTAPTGTDVVSRICAKLVLELKIEALLKALLLCSSSVELNEKISVLVALLKDCTKELTNIGAIVSVGTEAKVSLVACIVSIITLCVQVFVTLSIKFGLAICVELDVALRAFLAALGVCVEGILVLIAKALTSATVGLLVQVQLKLCLGVLGIKL